MFDFSSLGPLSYGVIRKPSSGIPNKTKFVVGVWWPTEELSETLQVTFPPLNWLRHFPTLLLDILNKRWQTLDLVSMVDEFKRSVFHEISGRNPYLADLLVITEDTLSSRPRFKREEDLS